MNENKLRHRVEHCLDELEMSAYDAGWNAVLDELNRCITEKHLENDRIAVEVLAWARGRIADLAETVEE